MREAGRHAGGLAQAGVAREPSGHAAPCAGAGARCRLTKPLPTGHSQACFTLKHLHRLCQTRPSYACW